MLYTGNFTDDAWDRILCCVEARKQKKHFNESVFAEIILKLPDFPTTSHGYHSKCYRAFTAIQLPKNELISRTMRSSCSFKASKNQLFPDTCLFCEEARKYKKRNLENCGACETTEAAESILNAAMVKNDTKLLIKIHDVDLIAKECKYHHSCKNKYVKSAQNYGTANEVVAENEQALKKIESYVETNIIDRARPELQTSVFQRYTNFCRETSGEPMVLTRPWTLTRHLLRKFDGKLKCQWCNNV